MTNHNIVYENLPDHFKRKVVSYDDLIEDDQVTKLYHEYQDECRSSVSNTMMKEYGQDVLDRVAGPKRKKKRKKNKGKEIKGVLYKPADEGERNNGNRKSVPFFSMLIVPPTKSLMETSLVDPDGDGNDRCSNSDESILIDSSLIREKKESLIRSARGLMDCQDNIEQLDPKLISSNKEISHLATSLTSSTISINKEVKEELKGKIQELNKTIVNKRKNRRMNKKRKREQKQDNTEKETTHEPTTNKILEENNANSNTLEMDFANVYDLSFRTEENAPVLNPLFFAPYHYHYMPNYHHHTWSSEDQSGSNMQNVLYTYPNMMDNSHIMPNESQNALPAFQHETPTENKDLPNLPPTKQIVCKFFRSSSCHKGDMCPFSHNLKKEACVFYHWKGDCQKGDHCPFSHDPITPNQALRLMNDYLNYRKKFEDTAAETGLLVKNKTQTVEENEESSTSTCSTSSIQSNSPNVKNKKNLDDVVIDLTPNHQTENKEPSLDTLIANPSLPSIVHTQIERNAIKVLNFNDLLNMASETTSTN